MASSKPRTARSPSPRELAEALGALIANTKRVRRKLSLVQVAHWLDIAQRGLGSLRAVGEQIGLSDEMLRQFATVNHLSPKVKKLVADRKIDRVDIAHRLSKLPPPEQYFVAKLVVGRELNSDDVRGVVTLRRSTPDADIRQVVDRVTSSRNIKEHVAYFPVRAQARDADLLRSRLAGVVRAENIRSISVQGALGTLIVNAEGRKRVAQAARNAGLTKRKFIDRIVHGELKSR